MRRELVAKFVVPGEPVSKERPRHGRDGRTYTPLKTKGAEDGIRWYCSKSRPIRWEKGYKYCVLLGFYLAGSNAKDLDNMAKTVLDALNKLVYPDDRDVVELVVTRHHDKAQAPCTKVVVYRMKEEEWKRFEMSRFEHWWQITSDESLEMEEA